MGNQIEDLIKETKLTNKLLIQFIFKDNKMNENIEILSKMGLQPKEIAEYLNTTPHSVSVVKNILIKKGKKK